MSRSGFWPTRKRSCPPRIPYGRTKPRNFYARQAPAQRGEGGKGLRRRGLGRNRDRKGCERARIATGSGEADQRIAVADLGELVNRAGSERKLRAEQHGVLPLFPGVFEDSVGATQIAEALTVAEHVRLGMQPRAPVLQLRGERILHRRIGDKQKADGTAGGSRIDAVDCCPEVGGAGLPCGERNPYKNAGFHGPGNRSAARLASGNQPKGRVEPV